MASTPTPLSKVDERAVSLIKALSEGLSHDHGVSSMSPAIYDIVWLSMIAKMVNGFPIWLFPECFDYILQN